MQLCNATLRLSGDLNFALPKQDVSVAEIVYWRLSHGEDAVVNITPTRKTTTSLRQERDRLLATYGQGKKENVKLIDGMFANVAVQGLTSLKDLGLPTDDTDAPAAPKGAAKPVGKADIPGDPGAGE